MKSRWSEWLLDIIESAPSFIFVALLRLNLELETAGWVGSALAVMVLIGCGVVKVRFNPILLGINFHLLIITPLIVLLYRYEYPEIGEVISKYSYKGVLITIFVVGAVLTLFTRYGFVALEGLTQSVSRLYSCILLVASLIAIFWAFNYAGSSPVGIAFPVLGLFILRRILGLRSNASFER